MKKILFPLLSLFLAYQSFTLMKAVFFARPEEFSGLIGFLISLLLNLFVTGVFAFPGFVFYTSKALPDEYYRIKDPKALSAWCRWLGISYFRSFLLFLFWGAEKNRKTFFDGTRAGLKNFEMQTRQSEFGHLASFVLVFLSLLLLLIKGHIWIVIPGMLVNIIFNFFPILLQRSHRVQLNRVYRLQALRHS
jgi:hypothetical protein